MAVYMYHNMKQQIYANCCS